MDTFIKIIMIETTVTQWTIDNSNNPADVNNDKNNTNYGTNSE